MPGSIVPANRVVVAIGLLARIEPAARSDERDQQASKEPKPSGHGRPIASLVPAKFSRDVEAVLGVTNAPFASKRTTPSFQSSQRWNELQWKPL